MLNLLQELENKITYLEAKFEKNLQATGNAHLARDFSDITTLRKSLEVLGRKSDSDPFLIATKSEVQKVANIPLRRNGISRDKKTSTPTTAFVLSKAVKDTVKTFGDDEMFSISEVWNRLKETYPNDITDDGRKRSASATLSNLTKDGELIRVKKGEGGEPTIYRLKEANYGFTRS